MATTRQKAAARKNLEKARAAQHGDAQGKRAPSKGMSTKEKDDLARSEFAFVDERKEPLVDAAHVRNAIARFNQVEGASDAERDRAWKRIEDAARHFDVDVEVSSWRELSGAQKRAAGSS